MLKNVKLKKGLKKSVFPVLTFVNKFIPKKDNIILLYSPNLGIRHNLKPLKDYLLKHGYDKKYSIICGIEDMNYAENEPSIKYVSQVVAMLYFLVTKHVYYTTGQIPIKPSKNQIVVHLDHGTAGIKTLGALSNINNGDEFFFTHYTAPSDLFVPIVAKEYVCSEKNVVINGEPVTDILYQNLKKYDLGNYDKIGLWAPTFRQSDYLGYDDSTASLLPLYADGDYEKLNEMLEKLNIKLFVKLHDAQDLSGYRNDKYSHLEILSDKEFSNKGYELYPMMKQIDFLLGDYSSVYLQFLLLNKPIGFVIPDIEEYKVKRGFVFENVLDYMPGAKIYEEQDLYDFFNSIKNGEDNFLQERKRVCDLVHYYQDGDNCKRALEIGKIYK